MPSIKPLPSIPFITMDIWHNNTELDLSSIPLPDPDTLTLFDTYDLDDIEWYTPSPAPPPSDSTKSPHTAHQPPAKER